MPGLPRIARQFDLFRSDLTLTRVAVRGNLYRRDPDAINPSTNADIIMSRKMNNQPRLTILVIALASTMGLNQVAFAQNANPCSA